MPAWYDLGNDYAAPASFSPSPAPALSPPPAFSFSLPLPRSSSLRSGTWTATPPPPLPSQPPTPTPAMSRRGSSYTTSGGSGGSRMLQQGAPESSRRLDLEEYPLGEETGLPLIPCPDCGLARVIERRSRKDSNENYLRVYFKCPRNGFPKLCGFYRFQRSYLVKLMEMGIVTIHKPPPVGVPIEELADVADVSSGYTDIGEKRGNKGKVKAKKEEKVVAKLEDLMWRFNLLMFVLAVFLGGDVMFFVFSVK